MTFQVFKMIAISALVLGGARDSNAAQDGSTVSSLPSPAHSTKFVKKRYSIDGKWSVAEVGGQTQIRFSEDFNTKGGPDLKVYLSKAPIEELDSKTAANSSVSIGVLKSKSGEQTYAVSEDINLSDYKSVIIHCEAFSVLWGGFDLPQSLVAASLTSEP